MDETGKTGGKENSLSALVGDAGLLGLQIAVGMALPVLLGYYLDGRCGHGIVWTLVGAAVGAVHTGYQIWKTARNIQQKDNSTPRDPDHPTPS